MTLTEDDPRIPKVPSRKKAIPGGEWFIQFNTYNEENGAVERYGSVRIADSFMAKSPNEVARLIAQAIYELATK